jgi:hypothetical protein
MSKVKPLKRFTYRDTVINLKALDRLADKRKRGKLGDDPINDWSMNKELRKAVNHYLCTMSAYL